MSALTLSPAWKNLQKHYSEASQWNLRDLFAKDEARADTVFRRSLRFLHLDYSKNIVEDETWALLRNLAVQAGVESARDAMFRGDKINFTEKRAVLHTALRYQGSGTDFGGRGRM